MFWGNAFGPCDMARHYFEGWKGDCSNKMARQLELESLCAESRYSGAQNAAFRTLSYSCHPTPIP